MSALEVESDVTVHVRSLRRAFHGRTVLDGIDLDVGAGEFVALLGASGSGKTTLLKILAGIDTPDAGDVVGAGTAHGRVPGAAARQRQARGVERARRAARRGPTGERVPSTRCARWASPSAPNAWPATLSGGEAQRVALARALVRDPQLLLLDEPFAALDALTRLRMQQLIGDLCARHRPATLLVTHDVEEAILLADRALVLRDGRIAVDVPIDLPRPRVLGGHAFDALRGRLLHELGVDVDRGEDAGRAVTRHHGP